MNGKMKSDIIPITPGYSAQETLDDIKRMDRVMHSMESIKTYDRSKKEYYTVQKYRFRGINDDQVRQRIKRSIKYYNDKVKRLPTRDK